jgi:glycosyltransferase involved in cell wall biosynthesis
MYFGAHGQANGLDCVLKAMAEIGKMPGLEQVRLRMVGDGPLKPGLIALARDLGLGNVDFERPVPKTRIPSLAAEADAFMASGAVNDPVAEAGAGITVPPEDPRALAGAIARLVAMPADRRAAMGRAGRAYVEANHGFDVLADRLADCLDQAVARHS